MNRRRVLQLAMVYVGVSITAVPITIISVDEFQRDVQVRLADVATAG